MNESKSDSELPQIEASRRPESELSSTKGVRFASEAGSLLSPKSSNQHGSPVPQQRKPVARFAGMLDGETPGLHVSESAPALSTVTEVMGELAVDESSESIVPLTEESIKEATSMDDYHFIGHLLHRVTEVSGAIPENAPAPWDVEEDLDLAANEVQIRSLSRSPEMLEVLSGLQELSKQFRSVRTSVASHRKHLAHTLGELQTAYIQLFEQMLTIVLRMQRKKDKAMREQLQFLTKENKELKVVNEDNEIGLKDLKLRYEAMEGLMNAAQTKAEVAEKQLKEMALLEEAYNGLNDHVRQMELLKDMDRKNLEARLKQEEARYIAQRKIEQQLLESRRLRMEERERMFQSKLKEMETQKQQLETIQTNWRPIPEMTEAEVQTHVNDDGLWDKQDGWVIDISGSMLARIMWRRARQFAGCPSCKGVGTQLKLLQQQIKEDQRVRSNNETLKELLNPTKKKTKGAKNVILKDWQVPDELVDFMCNLPKTIQAKQVRPLKWLVREIWKVYDEKTIADDIDDKEGQQVQDMNDFLMELFLKREGFREKAEIKLYEIIVAIKEYYKKNTMVKTFARFMNLLEETSKQKNKRKKQSKDKKNKNEMNLKPTNRALDHVYLSAYLFTRRRLLHRDKRFIPKHHSRSNSTVSSHLSSAPSTAGNMNANGNSQKGTPWWGSSLKKEPRKRISTDLRSIEEEKDTQSQADDRQPNITPRRLAIAPVYLSNETIQTHNLGEEALTAEFMEDLPLTVVMQGAEFWLRVDIVIDSLRKVLNFLTLEQLGACCREIEYNAAFLTASGKVQHMEGMRTVVRSAVRKEMLKGTSSDQKINEVLNATIQSTDESTGGSPKPPAQEEEEVTSQYTVLFNMDKVLELVIEVLAMQENKISDKLAQLFVEGDDNGDGVLSFPEFQGIVLKAAPQFSERRVLRMFREALTSGPESSFSIEKKTFTDVCKKHGLVKLIDIHTLERMEEEERQLSETKGSSNHDLHKVESFVNRSRTTSMNSMSSKQLKKSSFVQSKGDRKRLIAHSVPDTDKVRYSAVGKKTSVFPEINNHNNKSSHVNHVLEERHDSDDSLGSDDVALHLTGPKVDSDLGEWNSSTRKL